MINLLIGKDLPTLKDSLKEFDLSEKDFALIYEFGQHTLEAIIIYVPGSVFNSVDDLSVVGVSTLIKQIDSVVRIQVVTIGRKNGSGKNDVNLDSKLHQKSIVTRSDYALNVKLVELLIIRKLISLITAENYTDELPIFTKKGKGYFIPSHCYAMCNWLKSPSD